LSRLLPSGFGISGVSGCAGLLLRREPGAAPRVLLRAMAPPLLEPSGCGRHEPAMNSAQPIRRFTSVLALAAAVGVSGCAAEAYPPPVGGYTTVYATNVPPDMTVYPRVGYAGGYAYLVGNSWYYPSGNRWLVLRQEPPELYRYRTTTLVATPVYRAPPGYVPRQYAPPAQYGYPPPAVRER
jgi:hypothetical protein